MFVSRESNGFKGQAPIEIDNARIGSYDSYTYITNVKINVLNVCIILLILVTKWIFFPGRRKRRVSEERYNLWLVIHDMRKTIKKKWEPLLYFLRWPRHIQTCAFVSSSIYSSEYPNGMWFLRPKIWTGPSVSKN